MTEKQKQERCDLVDNAIYQLMKDLNPTKKKFYFQVQAISEIRMAIQSYFVEELKFCTDEEFYPYTDEEGEEF